MLNIIIASSDGLVPNASLTSVNLNSGDKMRKDWFPVVWGN